MYVHIGNDVILKTKDIVAILNVETLKQSRSNLRIINLLKDKSDDIKSVIIIQKNGITEEIFSIISTITLQKRILSVLK